MTAVREQAPRTLPRFVIRILWMLHRSAYRLTGGRFGLSRPEAGSRFEMLRLTTVGRRSGQPRVAIVGYYEDEPNLVTLAMNGWGEKERGSPSSLVGATIWMPSSRGDRGGPRWSSSSRSPMGGSSPTNASRK